MNIRIPTYSTISEEDIMELWAMLSLQCTQMLSNSLIKRLLTYYGTAHNAVQELSTTPFAWEALGIRRDCIATYLRHEWKPKAQYIWSTIQNTPYASILLYSNPSYPSLLRAITDPPPILYCLGNIELLTSTSIAVIGTRKSSEQGNSLSYSLSQELSSLGITVISGLAEGIDAKAHTGTLDAKGNTIAVLGNGIDTVYPAKNKGLSKQIAEKGCIVTEFYPSTPPKPAHFPIRNRIVSGLSLGVLVIEATIHSGTLTTVRTALEQGKNIYVVPTQYTSEYSTGSAYLLEEGAMPITSGKAILDDILPQIANTDISPTIRKILLEYHLDLEVEEKDYYDTFLSSLPTKASHSIPKPPIKPVYTKTNKKSTIAPNILPEQKPTTKEYQAPILKMTNTDIEYGLTALGEQIFSILQKGSNSIEYLVQQINTTASEISSELIMLEIRGLVQKIPGGHYGIVYE